MKTGLFKRIVTATLFLIPFWFLFLSALIVWFVQHNSYEQVQNWFRLRWPDAYDPTVFFNQNFTLAQYELLNKYSGFLFIVLGIVTLLLAWFRKRCWRLFEKLYEDIISILHLFRSTFINLSGKQKLTLRLLFVLVVCYRIYFFLEHTMHTDETASYLFFTRQGLLHSSINYVSTNNHIFFNILASVINSVFSFLPPKLIIRLPSLLADLFLWYGLFCIINKFGGFRRAIFVVAGACFCYIVCYYATQGRGYKLQEVFVVVSLISFWIYFIRGSSSGRGRSLLIFSLVLGSYSNPLFVYHLLGILLFGSYVAFALKKIPADELMKTFIALAGFTILAYLPVLLVNGIHGFVENRNAPTQNWQNLVDKIPFLIGAINYNFSLGKAGIYILLTGSVIFCLLVFSRRLKGQFYTLILYYFLCLVLSIVIVSLYKKVYPPERGFSYFVLLANLVFLNLVYDFITSKTNSGIVLWGFLFCKIAFCVRPLYWEKYAIKNQKAVQIPKEIYRDLDELTKLPVRSWQITAPNDYYFMYSRLYLIEHHRKDPFILNRGVAQADVIFIPDSYLKSLDLSGYRLWKRGLLTNLGDSPYSLSIYVSNSIK